ncbi:helix-turn-helix transcriptional regulator [Arabiibacter massiliensis]|uniref:helix-turn-helix transcriptional regulator n=1 Tax=Arabiibacter massiliensis TaxID=1870985 RepID=UPI00155ADB90|nr:helix-turn-helix transcriptional regulator [Arabiibacter massiliensis]
MGRTVNVHESQTEEGGFLDVAAGRLRKLASQGLRPERLLGNLFLRAWNYLFFWTGVFFLLSGAQGDASPAGEVFLVSATVFVAVSFLCAARQDQMEAFAGLHPRLFACVAAAAVATGSFFTLFASAGSWAGAMCLVTAGALTGAGTALLDIGWGWPYARTGAASSSIEVPLAFFVASLFIPLSSIVPGWICVAVALLLPFASAILLARCLVGSAEEEGDGPVSAEAAGGVSKSRRPVPMSRRRLLVKISLVSFIVGICNTLMPAVFSISNQSPTYSFVMPAATAFSLLLFLGILAFSRRLDFIFAYKPVLLFMIVGYLLLIPLKGSLAQLCLITASYTCFNVLNWLLLADVCRRFGLPVVLCFGLGRGALVGGSIAGTLLVPVLNMVFADTLDVADVGVVFCVICMLVSYLFVLTEKDVAFLSGSAYSLHEGLSMEEKALLIRRRQMIEACDLLASRYDLGERARDVLVCLAQGYTVSEIEEDLFMAKGTVNTHMHRIYQKLDVHKRKELMKRVEECISDLDDLARTKFDVRIS